MEDNSNIYDVIQRYCLGESRAEDRRVLFSWIEESPENKAEFLQQKRLFDEVKQSVAPSKPLPFSVESDKKTVPFKTILTYASAVAAACILAFIVFYSPEINYKTVSNNQTIAIEENLIDGSVVTINQGSSIEIAENFAQNRQCILKGEAYFNVAPDSLHPFTIIARNVQVTVLGTQFNIKEDSVRKSVTVQVTEGKVKCVNLISGSETILTDKRSASFKAQSSEIHTDTIINANHLAWFTHQLEFRNSSLEEVVQYLSEHYHTQFTFAEDSLKELKFNARIDNDKLEEIIQVLELTFALQIEHIDGSYRIADSQNNQ